MTANANQTEPRHADKFTPLGVSVSAYYDPDIDPSVGWRVTADGEHVHIDLTENRYVGPPFDRRFERRVFSVLVHRHQAEALLVELQQKLGEARS